MFKSFFNISDWDVTSLPIILYHCPLVFGALLLFLLLLSVAIQSVALSKYIILGKYRRKIALKLNDE